MITAAAPDPPEPFQAFYDNLGSFADAPEGVAKLRELILDLAVRGKLVEQDENDEPASELLAKIENERAKLVANKEIKTPKPLPPLDDNALPFDVPSGWEWARLGELTFQINDGVHRTPTYVPEGVPFLSIKDISAGRLDFSNTRFISPEEHETLIKRCKPERGDLLFTRIGTLGTTVLVDTDTPFSIFVSVGLIKYPQSLIDSRFFTLVMNSPLLMSQYDEIKAGGSHTNKLNLTAMPGVLIPLPPLSEQRRIVPKVDGLMSLCDELEARGSERVRLRESASRSCLGSLVSSRSRRDLVSAWQRLSDHFEVLYDTPETLAHLRQSILQLAVQGKLVPQDPNDEPAAELLGRVSREVSDLIEANEIPNPKRLPPIDDNGHCVPNGWQLIRSGELFTFVTSGSRGWAKYYSDVGPIFLRIGNLDYGTTQLDLTNIQRVSPPDTTETRRTSVRPNDILISVTGDTGMVGIVPPDFEQAHINQHIALTRPSKHVYPQYVAVFFTSPWALSHLHGAQRGIKNSLGLEDVRTVPILLPPLAEQKRIVAKVDQLLSQCDELSARLRDRQSTSEKLLTATIHHLLANVN